MSVIPRRISIVGTTGSGKTTLAHSLSICLGIPHIELDAIHWTSNWEPLPLNEFRAQTAQALTGNAWIVDGNYSKVRDIIWKRADTIVWLDYRLPRILHQLLLRTIHRVFDHEVLWNENTEDFRSQFLSQDSIFVWAIKSHSRRKKIFPELFALPEYSHLKIIRLPSPKSTLKWMGDMESLVSQLQPYHQSSVDNNSENK